MKNSGASQGRSASELISKRIAELGDWRGETLSKMRELIHEADPEVVEEWKWMGTPIFSHDGIICTGESYKDKVKLTFARGAALTDPTGLFNSSLDGNVRRAIDIGEGQQVDSAAFKALVRQAIALNSSKPSKKAKPAAATPSKPAAAKPSKTAKPVAAKTAKTAKPSKTAKTAKPAAAKSAKPAAAKTSKKKPARKAKS
ncbi:MAG TPA: DUF1801 domain-containing protein [Polyangiaceae bacterium]|jgi:hypothetical protein|nr:DUF1801 domain-containing protein [Polyangiaceae bacterium]